MITANTKSPNENSVHPMFVTVFNTAIIPIWSPTKFATLSSEPKAKLQPKQNAPDKTDKTLIQIEEWSLRVIAKQINPIVITTDVM